MARRMLWKRPFDLVLALALGALLLPAIAAVMGLMLIRFERPFFYVSERMKTVDKPFALVKFRTMRAPREGETNEGVSGGDKAHRISKTGRMLRRLRLDEVPQIWNVLRGDMSFVGPRPPLRRYTESHRALYESVLKSRPGITGLATIIFHHHETLLLREASTPAETEAVYSRRCVPRKARIDLLYRERASFGLDIYILYLTAAKLAPLPGRRARLQYRRSRG